MLCCPERGSQLLYKDILSWASMNVIQVNGVKLRFQKISDRLKTACSQYELRLGMKSLRDESESYEYEAIRELGSAFENNPKRG